MHIMQPSPSLPKPKPADRRVRKAPRDDQAKEQ